MKISLKVTLYKGKTYADGTHPVILRYVINRKVRKKVLYRCDLKDWDYKTDRVKAKSPNAAYINSMLSEKYSEAEQEMFDIQKGEKSVSDLFNSKKRLSLKDCFALEYKRLEEEFKSGYYDKMLAIEKQIADTSIDITFIDEKWFAQLIYDLTKIGNSGNTIKKKIKLIRGMILRYSSKGVTKEVKAITVATTKSLKQKLTAVELTSLVALELPEGSLLAATRDLFLLQVYLRGVRVGDLLQAYSRNFSEGRFVYTDDKQDKNYDIKLIPQAKAIVDRYKGRYARLFPFFTWTPNKKMTKWNNERERLKHKETCTSVVNANLKVLAAMAGINKPLSSHIARHTYARMAIDKIKNPMITMDLLGHSSLTIHQGYLNDIKKTDELDDANDDIFGS
jgi:site-specific recombinase XerD